MGHAVHPIRISMAGPNGDATYIEQTSNQPDTECRQNSSDQCTNGGFEELGNDLASRLIL